MHPHTAHKHTNLLWVFIGVIFCALFLVFSLPKSIQLSEPTGAQVVEFTPSVVTVSSVSPGSVYQMATVQLNITGADFNSSAVVTIENVTVFTPVVVNSSLIEVNITVPLSAGEGVYDINVTQDSESSSLLGGLTILEGPFDPSTLTNVTPEDGYIDNGEVLNLTYNVSTAFGVDPSTFNITGGYIEIENLNTSNDTYLDLVSWTSSGGIFTVVFEEHNFTEDGDYFGELYLNVSDGIVDVEREYYSYFGVGFITCFMSAGTCSFNASVGVPFAFNVSIFAATLPITSCLFGAGAPPGCSVAPGAGAPGRCEISCTPTLAGFFTWTLFANDSASSCAPVTCIANITGSPPPPSTGGSGGGSNPYPAKNCCCLEGSLKGKITVGKDCQNSPHNANCRKSTENTEDPVCKPAQVVQPVAVPPVQKPAVQSKPVQQPALEQKPVEVYVPPVQELKKTMPPLPAPVDPVGPVEQPSSFALAAVLVLGALGFLVYWQFFRRHK